MNFGSGAVAEGASGGATGRGPSEGRRRYNGAAGPPPPPKLDVGGGHNSRFAFGAASWPYKKPHYIHRLSFSSQPHVSNQIKNLVGISGRSTTQPIRAVSWLKCKEIRLNQNPAEIFTRIGPRQKRSEEIAKSSEVRCVFCPPQDPEISYEISGSQPFLAISSEVLPWICPPPDPKKLVFSTDIRRFQMKSLDLTPPKIHP